MYEQHWGLRRPPFDEAHAGESFVDLERLALARARLRHVCAQGQGAAAVVGPPGVGKTAVVLSLLRELDAQGWVASYVGGPLGGARDALGAIARDHGGEGASPLEAIEAAVAVLDRERRRACVAVDELHSPQGRALLEDLRMLLNIEAEGRRPLRLVLVGQDPLVDALRRTSSFHQRLAYLWRMAPMTVEETKHYILARLKAAGCTRGLFTKSAAELVCALSGGCPREVNRLCELALATGYGLGADKVGEDLVRMAAAELGLAPRQTAAPDAAPPQPPTGVDEDDLLARTPAEPREGTDQASHGEKPASDDLLARL